MSRVKLTGPESIPRRVVSVLGMTVVAIGSVLMVLWCIGVAFLIVVGGGGLFWQWLQK